MEPRIDVVPEMKLVGLGERMSLANDSTTSLWRALMPRRHEIGNRVTNSYISVRVYGKPGMYVDEMFAPETEFEKWAAVEVADHSAVPDGMRAYSLSGGKYALAAPGVMARGGPGELSVGNSAIRVAHVNSDLTVDLHRLT